MGRDYQRLADHIRREMAERDWTQRDLAERAGISPSALTDLLRGDDHSRVPNSVAKIAATFGWPAGTARRILDGEDPFGEGGRSLRDGERRTELLQLVAEMDDSERELFVIEMLEAEARRRRNAE